MAVIESKGDGFALYNGVKLRNIDTVWDKKKYLYAVVHTAENGAYYLTLNTISRIIDAYGDCAVSASGKSSRYRWDADGNEWNAMAIDRDVRPDTDYFASNTLSWTNHDIINTADNTVYLAASEPISLDGMNVIEWDGDTTGLETFGGAIIYRVSSAIDVDVSKIVCAVRRTESKTIVISGVLIKKDGFYQNAVSRYVSEVSETYPNAGIYLAKTDTMDVPLFAYYPIAEEQPEIDRGTLFILYRMFSPEVFHALTGKTHWSA